jgi:hypothetical protein
MFFDRFRKKKKEEVTLPVPTKLPEDLERFRVREYERPVSLPPPEPPKIVPRTMDDKIELILQKLETIDARLRLLEERLR